MIKKEKFPYIIAEIGVNHGCSISLAKKLILNAKKNGAQIVILNYDPTPFDSEASIIINEYLEKICDEIT